VTDVGGRISKLKRNVLAGAYTELYEDLADISPSCSSGDCSFPHFVSLSICSEVADVSEHMSVKRLPDRNWDLYGLNDNTTWEAGMPWNWSLVAPNIRSFDFDAITAPHSLGFPDEKKNISLADMYLLYSNGQAMGGQNATFHAMEMLFYPCAKAYAVTVTGGVAQWRELATSIDVISNTATSIDLIRNPTYQVCVFVGQRCEQYTWGNLTLGPPQGFEEQGSVFVDELTALDLSSVLLMSFWDGISPPSFFYTTNGSEGARPGGMVLYGENVYRMQGDISMAVGMALWQNISEIGDPTQQVHGLRNLTSNMAKGLEN
jgi:hypothetical protein